jgi:hypothetical protein
MAGRGAGVSALLAIVALLINVLAPPGFMIAPARHGATIVICTGHGPMTVAGPDSSPSHKGDKTRHDGACAFAGHGVGATPPSLALARPVAFEPARADLSATRRDLLPGRGLAAPPPPAQAPPLLI